MSKLGIVQWLRPLLSILAIPALALLVLAVWALMVAGLLLYTLVTFARRVLDRVEYAMPRERP